MEVGWRFWRPLSNRDDSWIWLIRPRSWIRQHGLCAAALCVLACFQPVFRFLFCHCSCICVLKTAVVSLPPLILVFCVLLTSKFQWFKGLFVLKVHFHYVGVLFDERMAHSQVSFFVWKWCWEECSRLFFFFLVSSFVWNQVQLVEFWILGF